MTSNITVKREEIINVKGTTKLLIGDPLYLDAIDNGTDDGAEKELIFNGQITAAPLGRMRIRETHTDSDDEKYGHLEWDEIEVEVVQGAHEQMLDTYLDGKWYDGKLVSDTTLGCDTASFDIETKYGFDHFNTGADGYYGQMLKYKKNFGMDLTLILSADLFGFDEVKERMLALFPQA